MHNRHLTSLIISLFTVAMIISASSTVVLGAKKEPTF